MQYVRMTPQATVGALFLLVALATSPTFGQRLMHSLEEASSSSSSANQQNAAAAASREFSDGNRHGKESSSSSSSSSSSQNAATSSRREVTVVEGGNGRVDQGRFGGARADNSATNHGKASNRILNTSDSTKTEDDPNIGQDTIRRLDNIDSTKKLRLTEEEEKRRRIVSEEEDHKSTRRGDSKISNGKRGGGKTVIINNFYPGRSGDRSGEKGRQTNVETIVSKDVEADSPTKVHYEPCPSGWFTTQRPYGPWCHKAYASGATWDGAQAICRSEGASLSGFETEDEYKKLLDYVQGQVHDVQLYLGGRRKEMCSGPAMQAYYSVLTNPCSRKNVFEWVYNASTNADTIFDHWSMQNPNWDSNHVETCLTWLIGRSYLPHLPYYMGEYNDNSCSANLPFMCGKPAGGTVQVPKKPERALRLTSNGKKCPPGWFEARRTTGLWCHKVFPTMKSTWDEAQAVCRTEGASLSGFENEEEFAAVLTYTGNAVTNTQLYLGARRKNDCNAPGFPHPDKSNICSRRNVFAWANGASDNQDMIYNHWSAESPDWAWSTENCLTWLLGAAYAPRPVPFYHGEFNDNVCSARLPFLCGKSA